MNPCTCWEDTEKLLEEKGYRFHKACSALAFAGSDGVKVRHYLPVQRLGNARTRSGGPTGIVITHCPFCGSKLPE